MVILFDLDGTLLDTSYDIYDAVMILLQEEKRATIPYEIMRPLTGAGAKNILKFAFKLDTENNPADHDYLETLVPRLLKIYMQTNFKRTVKFPGVDKLLQNIEQLQYRWGIVTNRLHAYTLPILNVTGLQHGSCVVSGDTTPHSKPHPEPLLHACRLLDIQPQDCLYVGDSETDIQAGKAAGMATMAVSFGYSDPGMSINNWQSDYIAHDANEIFPWIIKWSNKEI